LHQEAAGLLRLVIAANPKNGPALLLLAKSEIFLKDFAGAKGHLAQAERLQPAAPELLFVKALLAAEQGDNRQAFALLESALAANPNNSEMLEQFVIVAIRANYPSHAVRAAGKLLELQPDNLDYLYLFGAASLQSNKLAQAETALVKYLAARPTDERACVALGLTFAAQPDKLEAARQQMRQCLAQNPRYAEAAYQLGLSYKNSGELPQAVEYLEQTVRLAPNNASALRDLGAVYLQTGAETKARPVLEKAAALNPNDADTHFQLSRLYNLMGEAALAKKHLEIFQKLRNPKKEGM
jgi:tetratricopeptide (TPR) repeat protein